MSDSRLSDLVWKWQQDRQVPPEELCADCPELLGPLREQLECLGAMERFLGVAPGGSQAVGEGRLGVAGAPDGGGAAGPLPPRLGPFIVLSLLGEGAMGRVYRAEDPRLGREVALKVIRPDIMSSQPNARGRFLREARAAAAVQHDHIVPIFEVGEECGVAFIAMPLLAGEPLGRRLEREPVLPVDEVVRIGREVAEGLAAAHEKGLVHRDIKPANLWLEAPNGRVKVLDFGLARTAEGAGGGGLPRLEALTEPGAVAGTPGYMSPEQVNGERVGARSDLFSLGCLLYRIATGTKAFSGANLTAILRATVEHQPPAAHTLNPQVPAWLSSLIARLLAKRPEERPESARAVADALLAGEVALGGTAAHARAPGPARRAGAPYQWPPLPAHYVRRPGEEGRLAADLLRDGEGPGVVVSAVFGLGGIGKSTLAAAVAQHPEVLSRFPDGVLWATLGQTPEVASLLGGWIRDLGDHEFRPADLRSASGRLRQLLAERAVLLVVDDAWGSEHVEPFRAGGPRCRLMVTTRRATIADDLGAIRHELDVLDPKQAVELLASRLQRPLQDEEQEQARRLAEAVGRLPLALELAGVRVARGVAWEELLRALEREVATLEALEDPARRRQGMARLEASFHLSLRALRQKDEGAWHCFVWLGVLPDDTTLAAPMAALWDIGDPEEADGVLEYLWGEALLQPAPPVQVGGRQWRAYRVHDLLHDCARRLLTGLVTPGRPGEMAGLGLTWAEAQGRLLERYRGRTQGGQWHTLPADGYIHGRLSWHLERAGRAEELHLLLREETAEGRNGWFEADERLGQPTTFAEDVARAWKLADDAFRQGRESGFALQCRYGLVTASLNSLAGNLAPELLEALVRHGLWPVEQALLYARRTPTPEQKAAALRGLVPLVGPREQLSVLTEALRATGAIRSEKHRANALAGLAPHLPPELLGEALQGARDIGDEGSRALALVRLAPHLPEGLRGPVLAEGFQVARAIGGDWFRARALAGLAPHLPPGLLGEALQAAWEIGDEGSRAEALAGLVPYLPEGLRGPALPEALQGARDIGDVGDRALALARLAPHLPPELLGEALQAARDIGDERSRAKALAGLAPHLPEGLRGPALADALLAAQRGRALALARLAPHLPPNLLAEALQAARDIGDERSRAKALAGLAPHLPEGLRGPALADALLAARDIGDKGGRARALAELAPHLPEGLLGEALQTARAVRHEGSRARALAQLAPHLPPGLLGEALQAAWEIGDEGSRAEALAGLVPYLPEGLRGPALPEALRGARDIGDVGDRARALAGLAPHLPEGLRGPALADALLAARAISDEGSRALALASLAPHLPPDLRGPALADGLLAARAVRHEGGRALALAGLAPHLPDCLRGPALADTLLAARAISDEGGRALALAELAPHLPPEQLAGALRAARAISDEGGRAGALAGLAPHLPPELLGEALQAARALRHEWGRAATLVGLASGLPPNLLAEALQAARDIGDEWSRAKALAGLAPHLPEGLRGPALADALLAAQAIESERHRTEALAELAPHLATMPRKHLASLWTETLHQLANRSRSDLLADLRAITPVLTALAGPNATVELGEVAQSIIDVARWWP
jgi:hypothetical protein